MGKARRADEVPLEAFFTASPVGRAMFVQAEVAAWLAEAAERRG